MERDAYLSICGTYRFWLTRRWDKRPVLLVVMFNPSTADHQVDDPTISLLSWIASHNGFGGITVVNAIPLRTPAPDQAAAMARGALAGKDFPAWDELQHNLIILRDETADAGAVMLAWGALGAKCPAWMNIVQDAIREALPAGVGLYCLGVTAGGHPKHPLARGKHKVPKDAPLLPWS